MQEEKPQNLPKNNHSKTSIIEKYCKERLPDIYVQMKKKWTSVEFTHFPRGYGPHQGVKSSLVCPNLIALSL